MGRFDSFCGPPSVVCRALTLGVTSVCLWVLPWTVDLKKVQRSPSPGNNSYAADILVNHLWLFLVGSESFHNVFTCGKLSSGKPLLVLGQCDIPQGSTSHYLPCLRLRPITHSVLSGAKQVRLDVGGKRAFSRGFDDCYPLSLRRTVHRSSRAPRTFLRASSETSPDGCSAEVRLDASE